MRARTFDKGFSACHFRFLIIGAIGLLLSTASRIEAAPSLPVETFFRDYQYREAKLSPNGKYLGALSATDKGVGLVVIELDDLAACYVYAERIADVEWFAWVGNDRLIFGMGEEGYQFGNIMAVNRDRKMLKSLSSRFDLGARFLQCLPDSTNEILVTSSRHASRDWRTGLYMPHVYRMNVYTGKMRQVAENPGNIMGWFTDHAGEIRGGLALEGAKLRLVYRPGSNAPFQTLEVFGLRDDVYWPHGFEYDNRTLLVGHYGDRSPQGIYRYDTAEHKLKELAFRHAEYDAASLVFSNRKRSVVGIQYLAERPEVFWFDTDYKRMQTDLDRTLTNSLNLPVSMSEDGSRAVCLAASDRTPGAYFLLDNTTHRLQKLFDLADWIEPAQMAPMRSIKYSARDGLLVHGYITVPPGRSAAAVPMVVYVHGGPMLRDVWGFDPVVQFLANRGYAVLQVNFRGSCGFGRDFLEAGFKEWGLKQQDDITDGVKWAIEQGIADPKRVGILGASYGGFAALTGLIRTPELYRCGVSLAGVADIPSILKALPDLQLLRTLSADAIGDAKEDKAWLKDISPVNHAEAIEAPVLLAHGKNDPKVPIEPVQKLAKSLRARGKLYDFIIKEGEGHGFLRETNRIEFWKKADDFLKQYLN
jgi:dipeptidyl aminopeptidase/acylaminoacyl peptidase